MSSFPSSSSSSPAATHFGAMLFGEKSSADARQTTLEQVQEMLDVLKAHKVFEIDTARVYGDGTSEEFLGNIEAEGQGFRLSTKIHPTGNVQSSPVYKIAPNNNHYTHGSKDIHDSCQASLKALKTKKVDIYYLHRPDPVVPRAETLAAIDQEYKAGSFERFGISNYSLDEVKEILTLCEENDWVKPKVYQGMYNAINRGVEKDLLPLLRSNGISFVAYSPLAGGFFTMKDPEQEVESNKRFDKDTTMGQLYRSAYWTDKHFSVLKTLRPLAEKHGVGMIELALRWIKYHSFLSGEAGDAFLLGSSSPSQLETNLRDLEKGPLPKELVDAMEGAWETLKEGSFETLASSYNAAGQAKK